MGEQGDDAHERYYSDRMPVREELDIAGLNFRPDHNLNSIWGARYKASMVAEADKCVGLIERLEWLYFDQYSMAVQEGVRGVVRCVRRGMIVLRCWIGCLFRKG